MRRAIAIFLIGALGSGSSTAAPPLQPTGPWHVDYDTAQCLAVRDFGTVAKPLELILKPSPNGGVMRILVVRQGSVPVEQAPVTLKLGDTPVRTWLLNYTSEKDHLRISSINVPMSEFKAHLDATVIGMSGSAQESFAVSQLPAVSAELDKCLLDLQAFWNLGPAHDERIASDAKPQRPLRSLFSPGDYPRIALAERQSGFVKVVFLIDEQGRISDCSVDKTSGVPSLDTMSCYVFQSRAKFDPAIGKHGQPVRSGYCERIVWRVEGTNVPLDDGRIDPLCPERSWAKKG